jgi:chaperonin GroES
MAAKKKKTKAKPAVKTKAKTKAKAKAVAKSKPAAKPAAKAKPVTKLGLTLPAYLTPLEDRLVIELEGSSNTTSGGLIIPGTVSVRPSRGKVLAAGRGRRNKKGQVRPLDVHVGDSVLFSEWAGTKLDLGGREVLILREDEILGIVT